ncbi:MAG: hypothetical protein KC613_20190, partial [Myxococcales bacterium]|nr:hypothetical protein [Myxococcales bacterium]
FTVGAQPVRWGTGRLWNPTDVLNRNRLNPLTPVDFRTGVPMARVRFPIEAIGGSLELLGDVADAQTLGDLGAAARLQLVAGPTEWSLSARYRRNLPLMLGVDGSAGVGPFDLYAEAALTHGGHPTRWTGSYRLPTDAAIAAGPAEALGELALPQGEDRDDDWIPQVVVGLEYPIQYSEEDSLIVGVEYFHNDAGYADASLYPWLLQSGDFQPFYLGRHSVAAFVVLMAPGSWNDTTFVLNALANLSDETGIARLNVSHAIHRHLFLEPYIAVPFGPRGGEYRFTYTLTDAQAGWLGDFGQPLPFEGGLVIPAPVLQAGLWLRVML